MGPWCWSSCLWVFAQLLWAPSALSPTAVPQTVATAWMVCVAHEDLPPSLMWPSGRRLLLKSLDPVDEPVFLLQIRKLKLQLEEERQKCSRGDGSAGGDLAGLQNGSDLQFIEMQSRCCAGPSLCGLSWSVLGPSSSVCWPVCASGEMRALSPLLGKWALGQFASRDTPMSTSSSHAFPNYNFFCGICLGIIGGMYLELIHTDME